MVVAREAVTDTVVLVQNRGNCIKPEAIDVVFVQEPCKISKKESLDLISIVGSQETITKVLHVLEIHYLGNPESDIFCVQIQC